MVHYSAEIFLYYFSMLLPEIVCVLIHNNAQPSLAVPIFVPLCTNRVGILELEDSRVHPQSHAINDDI